MQVDTIKKFKMERITYGNKKIYFKIQRGRRKKTVAIHIQPNIAVFVLSPQLMETEKIKRIVRKRAKWIIEKQEKLKKIKPGLTKKDFVSGETFPYLGRNYRLKITKTDSPEEDKCKLFNGRLHVYINKKLKDKAVKKVVREKLTEWYMERAKEKINERIDRYAIQIGKSPKKVIIKNQEKRWGSCSHSGTVRFNWKAVMAPIVAFDYIIVHELCHLLYPNHSERFWRKVESIIPDYKKQRNWLKDNNMSMLELL